MAVSILLGIARSDNCSQATRAATRRHQQLLRLAACRCNRRRSIERIERCDASHHDQSPGTLCPHRGIVAIPVLGAAASLAPRWVTRTCPATADAAAVTSNATAAANARSALMPPRDSAPAIGRSSAWQRLFSAWIDAIAGARVHSSAGAAYNMGCPALISPTDGL
ncbi:hypothetical protein FHT09_002229 [Xanthomonas arboricola]|nr:hypothetical protein [Xanthomonas sp. CFBP 8152]